ncbi:16S rRNA (cytosine(1402)-N(4))-methyltransferase RsmH [Patescibacteria group bacterium]
MTGHVSVLMKEVLENLDPKPGDVVLDATINGGGHAKEILKKITPEGKLFGVEQDLEIIKKLRIENTELINGNFRDLDKFDVDPLDAALFDLGMSSFQLEESGRGFSFQKDEPLHMNFKINLAPEDLTAKEILNTWPKEDLFEILKEYGEERNSKSISENIVKTRKMKKFKTTFDLVEVIRESVPESYTKNRLNFATKTFQALRIAVNDELNTLSEGMEKAWNLLKTDGRLVVISFHSLEDRIVKNFMRSKKQEGLGIVLNKKPVEATKEEIKQNPRSRSAKLRVIVKK